MQEKQTDKVIMDATRSVLGDMQEDDWVRLIRVELTMMDYLLSGRTFQSAVRMRSAIGGHYV